MPHTIVQLILGKTTSRLHFAVAEAKAGQVFYIDSEWYEPKVVSHDKCERFMKLSLAKSVTLDGDYMNHSIRSTVISTLDHDSFEARHIIQLSSHKSKSTVKEYSTRYPDNKRKEMFQSLTNAMTPHPKKYKLQL